MLAYGATAVWVGTRFSACPRLVVPVSCLRVCAEEAGASPAHQKAVMSADHETTIRTVRDRFGESD